MNKHIVTGNVGKQPEVFQSEAGKIMARFTVATHHYRKDPVTGGRLEETDWIYCVAFGKKAELIRDYVRKGDKIGLEGRVRNRSFQGTDGQTKFVTETIINEIEFLSSMSESDSSGSGYSQGVQREYSQPHSNLNQHGNNSDFDTVSTGGIPSYDTETDDDDLPFG